MHCRMTWPRGTCAFDTLVSQSPDFLLGGSKDAAEAPAAVSSTTDSISARINPLTRLLSQRDEERIAFAAHEEQYPLSFFRAGQLLVEIRDVAHRLAVDFDDDVALLEPGLLGGAARLDRRDDDSGGAAELEIIGHLRRHFLNREPEIAFFFRRGDDFLFLQLGDRHRKGHFFFIAQDFDVDLL